MKLSFRKSFARGAAEFFLHNPENFLLVQGTGTGGMLIRATADNLTPAQREIFIQYLCAEGFIDGNCESPSRFHERIQNETQQPVRWIVDPFWPVVDPAYALHIRRLRWWIAGTMMVWLALMALLVCF